MSVYYQDDYVTLYHGDCRELCDVWVGGDVLVTDPPYGMSYVSNSGKSPTRVVAGDDSTALRDDVLSLWGGARPAVVFGTWRADRPVNRFRHLLVWDKGEAPGMGDLSMPWGHSHEEIYVFGGGFTTPGKRLGNVLRFDGLSSGNVERLGHPTPKPVALMRHLLERCPPGLVVDPFAGSGSTLRAAKDLGRLAVGVEIDEEYCEAVARRLSQECLVV